MEIFNLSSKMSKVRDVDKLILGKLSNGDLLNVLVICKYFNSLADESFWMKRSFSTPYIDIRDKEPHMTWKDFYISCTPPKLVCIFEKN